MRIDKSVSMKEAALKIYKEDNVPLIEKFDAWNELILTMSDCRTVVRNRRNCEFIDFREFLIRYIVHEKEEMECIMNSSGAAYLYKTWGSDLLKGPFYSFDVCWEKGMQRISSRRNPEYKGFIIEKYPLPHKEMTMDEIIENSIEDLWCGLNEEGQITQICSNDANWLDEVFLDMAYENSSNGVGM